MAGCPMKPELFALLSPEFQEAWKRCQKAGHSRRAHAWGVRQNAEFADWCIECLPAALLELAQTKQQYEAASQCVTQLEAQVEAWRERAEAAEAKLAEVSRLAKDREMAIGRLLANETALQLKLADWETRYDAQNTDSMIAHRWFARHFGEIMNGRDFAVKCPMADTKLAAAAEDTALSKDVVVAGAKAMHDLMSAGTDWASLPEFRRAGWIKQAEVCSAAIRAAREKKQ